MPWSLKRPESFSRSPYGERGLKSKDTKMIELAVGRSPYGERGLK